MLVSSRRCILLLTALLLFWLFFIGSIVSFNSDKINEYASRLGISEEHTTTWTQWSGSGKDVLTNAIPTSWMKDLRLTPAEPAEQIIPHSRVSVEWTQAVKETHNEVFSRITTHGAFFRIDFGKGNTGLNPNIIPHPFDHTAWIIVAQEFHGFPGDEKPVTPWSVEMVCNAKFDVNGTLECVKPPSILPIAATPVSPKCPTEIEVLNLNVGPHDARVFYGPGRPYTTYGSQSKYTCLGQFAQDFRYLVDWGMFRQPDDLFFMATDIEKPNPGPMEKNFFLFWDLNGAVYAHYDIYPKRIFSKLNADGTAGTDLAPRAKGDAQCWQQHLELNPLPTEVRSSIHQATNSLAITLCSRSSADCVPDGDNTFIMHIYQHKIYTSMFHSRYEPYVVLFSPKPPFEMYAITSKPLWIHGRKDGDQMFYITSMSWRDHGQTYQGYLDDTLFVTFGIDDSDTGAIDITAEELLKGLMMC